MRPSLCLALVILFIFDLGDASRSTSRSRSSSSSSSSSRSSSSRSSSSRSSSSWGSSASKSSYPTQSFGSSRSGSSSSSSSSSSGGTQRKSFGTKVKEKLGFGKKPSTTGDYPKQAWGAGSSSGYPTQSFSPGTQTAPKQNPVLNPAINTNQRPVQSTNVYANQAPNVGGGGFVGPKPVQNTNFQTNQASNIGGGGFVAPPKTGNNYGYSNTGSSFNQGSSNNRGFGSHQQSTANRAFGSYQPTNFNSYAGSYSNGQHSYGARAPGYGTSWGINFAGGAGQYNAAKPGYSKKALGLGVGAGFLGGAALGVGGTMATYSAVHKYKKYKSMLNQKRHHRKPSIDLDNDWDDDYEDDYYRNYYLRNECYEGCPHNSHCEYSFCECNYGYIKRWGRCESDWGQNPGSRQQDYRPQSFDPFKTCNSAADCMNMDMNLICNKELTTGGNVGKCECRRDMKWNTEALECQVYLDVDCSKFTYDTKPSAAVRTAVNEATNEMESMPEIGEGVMLNKTETPDETIDKSLLKHMDVNTASEDDLLEAYCRDIDAYSFDLNQAQYGIQQKKKVFTPPPPTTPKPPYPDPDRPPQCEQPSLDICGAGYQTKDCSEGWKLNFNVGEEYRFKWATPHYAYKNKIELVAVRPKCTLTVWDKNDFSGETITIKAEGEFNKWVNLADPEYQKFNRQIKSVKCICEA